MLPGGGGSAPPARGRVWVAASVALNVLLVFLLMVQRANVALPLQAGDVTAVLGRPPPSSREGGASDGGDCACAAAAVAAASAAAREPCPEAPTCPACEACDCPAAPSPAAACPSPPPPPPPPPACPSAAAPTPCSSASSASSSSFAWGWDPAPVMALVGPGLPAAPVAGGMTVVLTVFKRPHLGRQLAAVESSTVPPAQVLVYQTGDFAPDATALLASRPDVGHVQVRSFTPGVWPGVFGRFALALQAAGEHTCILDDDVIPLPGWLATVSAAIERYGPHTVVGCSGRVVTFGTDPATGGAFVTGFASTPGRPTDETDVPGDVFVDFPVHCYCARTSFFKAFWGARGYAVWWNGEDLTMGAVAAVGLGGRVVVPRQARGDGTLGDNVTALGADPNAVSSKAGHIDIRVEQVMHWVSRGWRPLQWPANATAVRPDGGRTVTGTVLNMSWAGFPPPPVARGGARAAGAGEPQQQAQQQAQQQQPAGGGRWSALPVTAASEWLPGAGAGADEREPLLPASRAGAARALAGRNISFLGDSLVRWQYYSVLAWLFGCLQYGGPWYDAAPLPGATPQQRAGVCADVEAVAGGASPPHSEAPHTTIVPTGDGGDGPPLTLRWWWSAYVADLLVPGNKTPSANYGQPPPGPTAPELLRGGGWVVLHAGPWHLRFPRQPAALACGGAGGGPPLPDDYDSLLSETRALIDAVGAAAPDARGRVAWRALGLLERESPDFMFHGCWNNAHVARAGGAVAELWRRAGYAVVDTAKYHHTGVPPSPSPPAAPPSPGASPTPGAWRTTVDGFHPAVPVQVAAFREAASALLRRAREGGGG